jgi:vacuolar-type H+-ATPase subunit I/STV1
MHKGQEDAKKKQLDAKKMLLKIDSEEAEERTSRAIEKMEREIKRVMEDIQRKVERAKDSGDKEKLESLKQEAEVQIKLLEYEKKKFEEELKEADEHAEQLASLLLSAEFADDYEERMSAYKESLEIVTLREPKNNFSKDIGNGASCIRKYKVDDEGVTTNHESGVKVEVTFEMKDKERDTLARTCRKDDFAAGDVPCDDCDWVP